MRKQATRWSKIYRHYGGQKPGDALVKWLNNPVMSPKFIEKSMGTTFIEKLLADAQLVYGWLERYESDCEFRVARKNGELPDDLWDAKENWNETVATFTHAPQIDLDRYFDGERLSWRFVSEDSPIALFRVQVDCIFQLIQQGAILKIRRCKNPNCSKWFFRRLSIQEFCSPACRWKVFASTPEFKKKRSKWARENYQTRKELELGSRKAAQRKRGKR